MASKDPFPCSEFNDWAETYDISVSNEQFPFIGYKLLLRTMVELAEIRPGMRVLDLGTGTGNLAVRFANIGCSLCCTDFSPAMLEKARQKIPGAQFVVNDLRGDWPLELDCPFDRIVSAYVFHHFDLNQKIRILRNMIHLIAADGRIIIGDIAFPDARSLETIKNEEGDNWEEEFYWLADEATQMLEILGFKVEYRQVSSCAGIYTLQLNQGFSNNSILQLR
jgi:putative AdoMet-dependent methyltransferase